LLIGTKEQERSRNLVLYRSVSGTGYKVFVNMADIEESNVASVPQNLRKCSAAKALTFNPQNSGVMGMELP
jgi:hypothetical protein